MDELGLTVLSRTAAGAFEDEPGRTAQVVLFDRPERYAVAAPRQPARVAALRVELAKGARFRLHGLVVRRADGSDLYRWAGAGELFRESRGLRFARHEGAVAIECVEDGGGFVLGFDPGASARALTVLLSVSADGPSTVLAERTPDRIALALNHIHQRLETLTADTRRLAEADERLAEVQARLIESEARLEVMAARHAEQIAVMRAEEGERHEALLSVIRDHFAAVIRHEQARSALVEAQLAQHRDAIAAQSAQINALFASTSWRVTAPLRFVMRLVSGKRAPSPVEVQLATPEPEAPAEAPAQEPLRSRPEPQPVRFPTPGAVATLTELAAGPRRALDLAVSVIIPTFNAGPEFYWLLRKLKGQQGVKAVEVVVVDSGSSDGTDTLAEEFGCTVVRIPNSEFSHSHARNLGADNATGDLLLFTVQDAYPVGDWWLHSLALALTEPPNEEARAAAVSCSEFPRRDSELLYNAAIDTHYRFLGCRDGDRIGRMVTDDHHSLRTQGQLSDVACLIPAETFRKYRYQGRYAEDLMLGVRLLRDGLKTAMLSSVKVIHSHNRPTAYHLKRTFVDVVFLTEVFPDFEVPPARSAAGTAAGAAALAPLAESWRPTVGNDAGRELRAFSAGVRATPVADLAAQPVDFGFAPLGPWLAKAMARKGGAWKAEAEQVRSMYADRLDHLAGFVERTYGEVDAHLAGELAAAAHKTLAATVGAQLAFLYLHVSRDGPPAAVKQVDELRALMTAGI